MRTKILLCALFAMATTTAFAGDNPRVYVTDSNSWAIGGGGAGVDGTGAASGSGGARPQTAEIIKTFNQRCPNVIITNRKEKADYIVLLDHEGGKSDFGRDNKIVVFNNASGDSIFSRSTRSLGNAVKDACPVIYHDFSRRAAAADSNKQVDAMVNTDKPESSALVADETPRRVASVHVTSTPSAGDILVDGKFVGSTPSTLQLAPGDHTISIQKNGYTAWQRSVHIVSGDVNLVADLQPAK